MRHTVYEHAGMVLTYEQDGIEAIEFETPREVRDVTPPDATAVQRELGKAHLNMRITFKEGHVPTWVEST